MYANLIAILSIAKSAKFKIFVVNAILTIIWFKIIANQIVLLATAAVVFCQILAIYVMLIII